MEVVTYTDMGLSRPSDHRDDPTLHKESRQKVVATYNYTKSRWRAGPLV